MQYLKKSEMSLPIIQTSALALALLWLAGCESTGYQKGALAAKSLDTAAVEVAAESAQLETAISSLEDLVNKPAGDLKPQLQRFSLSLDQLVAAAHKTQATGQLMAQKNAAYFAVWRQQDTTMTSGIIRSNSEARLTEVTNHFQTIDQRYQEAQKSVQPLIAYLRDLRTALSADLTANGLDSQKAIVANATQEAGKVKAALGELSSELAASSTRMSSVIATAQATPGS